MADERFNADGLVRSEGYARTMAEAVLPRLRACRTDGTIPGADGRPLFVSRFDAASPRGTVVIVHGFTECADKFAEIIHSLLANGLSVLAYDQRGHGRSWRAEGLGDLSLTHVDRFGEYVGDLEQVVARALAGMPRPWTLFAHSMGGAVSALFLERHADVFSRAALCAPMIAPNLAGIPAALGKVICAVPKALGRGRKRMFASKPYAGPEDFATSCATGRARFDWFDAVKAATPEFQNNGPTYGWTLESAKVTGRILAPGEPEKIACPVRLYTAALDNTVLPEAQKQFISRVKQGSHQTVEGAKHEIYRSADDVLFPWWHNVLSFLKGE